MKKISLIMAICLFIFTNLYANEDKLDILDQQSKEFFKAITGLEKDYLEEQIGNIKNKQNNPTNIQSTPTIYNGDMNMAPSQEEKELSEEEYEKEVFKHENEMARLTTDFTRTKKLKDIKIKSMYTFNGKNFVVIMLDEDEEDSKKEDKELSLNIEGRYTVGDSILTHRITSINTRTKTVKLYKKLDEEYGYSIYLSNFGISVSDLKKKEKKEEKLKEEIISPMKEKEKKASVKEAFKKIANKNESIKNDNNLSTCLYTVNVSNLNVRNDNALDATILRILKRDDQFTILEKNENWLKINTIYKKVSGDVMVVEDQNNWVNFADTNIIVDDKNCL